MCSAAAPDCWAQQEEGSGKAWGHLPRSWWLRRLGARQNPLVIWQHPLAGLQVVWRTAQVEAFRYLRAHFQVRNDFWGTCMTCACRSEHPQWFRQSKALHTQMQTENMAVHWCLKRTSITIAEEREQIVQESGWLDVWEGGPVRECVAGEEWMLSHFHP